MAPIKFFERLLILEQQWRRANTNPTPTRLLYLLNTLWQAVFQEVFALIFLVPWGASRQFHPETRQKTQQDSASTRLNLKADESVSHLVLCPVEMADERIVDLDTLDRVSKTGSCPANTRTGGLRRREKQSDRPQAESQSSQSSSRNFWGRYVSVIKLKSLLDSASSSSLTPSLSMWSISRCQGRFWNHG